MASVRATMAKNIFMIKQDDSPLRALALVWARNQEEFILERGVGLSTRQREDAKRVGVREIDRVRLLVVDRISLPENAELAEAFRRTQIITDASRAVTLGYAILIRADRWQDRELVLHQLVHVAQCERCGGLEPFVQEYLSDRANCANFSVGTFEDEARGLARQIFAADAAEEK